MKRRGFSLLEVLGVIAIIAIISAVLFTAIVNAKRAAKVTSCIGKLSQIGHALNLYAQDSDELAPPWATHPSMVSSALATPGYHYLGDAKSWKRALMHYGLVESQFWCPFDPFRGKKYHGFNEPSTSDRWKHTSYSTNLAFGPAKYGSPHGVFRLSVNSPPGERSPSETVYLSDTVWEDTTAPPGVNRLIGPHDNGRKINALYLDGSVRTGVVEQL